MLALIYTYPIFFHKILFIVFLSIRNMGINIKIRVLAALQAEILQKDSNAPKSRRPSLKMAPVAKETPSKFLNYVFEIELPYIYFLNTKTIILFVTFSLRITLVIMNIPKKRHFQLFLAIFSPFLGKFQHQYILIQFFFDRILFIGFLSIRNMGMKIKIRVLAALQAEILQNDSNAPKSRRPSWKMAAVKKGGKFRRSTQNFLKALDVQNLNTKFHDCARDACKSPPGPGV